MDLKGKRLLVLGGSSASVDIIKNARQMGVYIVVADMSDKGEGYKMADEGVLVSTTDYDALAKVVKEKNIDGIFCGPSEFNIFNTMKLCEKVGLPFYANEKLWNQCADKLQFREFCTRNGLDVAAEYHIDDNTDFSVLTGIEYPVIIKPVDGCSSKGISVCNNNKELEKAYKKAKEVSVSRKVIVEQYIDTRGRGFSFRYFISEGKAYPYLFLDTFIADPVRRKCLVSAFAYAPSDFTKNFIDTVDANMKKMLTDMGIENGTAFIQALPYKGKFYCHDMGYRLSGGMMYKMTEPLNGINDMKMMIRYALGGKICEQEDIDKLNNFPNNSCICSQIMLPLDKGTITKINGWEKICNLPQVTDVLQYYNLGDTIKEEVIGTLGQHFARVTLACKDREEMENTVREIQRIFSVKDENDNEMYNMRFDFDRMNEKTF
ncbi:MAG: ATP-grasp domain-containing protein [Clostridia bacterium]|nr:ATP-grasp domain-containing protein [Clostridia bacterium]